jgi:hypothetical protein
MKGISSLEYGVPVFILASDNPDVTSLGIEGLSDKG